MYHARMSPLLKQTEVTLEPNIQAFPQNVLLNIRACYLFLIDSLMNIYFYYAEHQLG